MDIDMETNLLLLQSYTEAKEFEKQKAMDMVDVLPQQPQFYYYSGLAYNQLAQFKSKRNVEMGLDYLVDDNALTINFNIQLGEASWFRRDEKKDFYF
jgi:hypothetical protein